MKKRFKYIITTLFITISLVSCTKNFVQENTNNDAVTQNQVSAGQVFSNILVSSSTQDMEARTNYCHAFMQLGYSSFWSGTTYSLSDGISSRYWNGWYDVLRNMFYVLPVLKADPSQASTYAAARIWKVFIFQKLTDYYGDIPYSQAGQAVNNIFTPVYDTQQSIYTDMISELRASITLLNNNNSQTVQGDQFYGGSASQWKKLASSLLLRIGMRLIKVDPTTAASLVNEAVTNGVMTSNTDMPVLMHSATQRNVFFIMLNDQQFFLHKTLVTRMKITKDPRLNIYGGVYTNGPSSNLGGAFVSSDTTRFVGYSFNAADPQPTARVNIAAYGQQTSPFFEFPYAEVEFLLAEANLRGYITDIKGATGHYAAGITASMQSLSRLSGTPTIATASINSYIAANPLIGTTAQQIALINTEFWIQGFLFDGDEVWSNWRRTGYPALTPNPNTLTGPSSSPGVIPRKLPYPQTQFQLNPTNVNNALKAYNGLNDFNSASRVWWDK